MNEDQDVTEEIVDVVDAVHDRYRKKFEKYAKEVTQEVIKYFDKNNIPTGLRHALMSYAHVVADDMALELAYNLAMCNFDLKDEEPEGASETP